MWYTEFVNQKRKEVRAVMAYNFTGIDVDELIYGECELIVSER